MSSRTSAHLRQPAALAVAATLVLLCCPQLVAQTAGCVPPPAGVVAWWPGEGDARDSVGAQHGTLLNGATFAPGKVNSSFSFDGVNDHADVPDSPGIFFANSQAFTVEAWFMAFSDAPSYLLLKNAAYGIRWQGRGQPLLFYNGNNHFSVRTSWELSRWYHVAMVDDGVNSVKLYIDGVLDRSEEGAARNPNRFSCTSNFCFPLQIGAWYEPGAGCPLCIQYFRGLVDELTLYNRALSAAEVQRLVLAGNAGKCALSSGTTIRLGDILVVDPGALGGDAALIKVDPITGAQTIVSSGGLFVTPRGIAVDATGQIIVADLNAFGGGGGIIRVDSTTGAQTTLSSGGLFVNPAAVAIDTTGDIIVADAGPSLGSGSIIRVEPSGTQTLISSGGMLVDPHGVAIDASGNIVVSEHHIDGVWSGAIISVNPTTGTQTLISSGGLLIRLVHVTVAPSGDIIAASVGFDGPLARIVRVNPTMGGQTAVSSEGVLVTPSGVGLDTAGSILVADQNAFGGPGGVIRVDPLTGAQTVVSAGGLFVDPLGLTVYGHDNGAGGRTSICHAFADFAQAVRTYQEAAITVVAHGDVGVARGMIEPIIKDTFLIFAEDLLAGGIPPRLAGIMTRNTASDTAKWLATHMFPELTDLVAEPSARFIAEHVLDWTGPDGINNSADDATVASYINEYFHDNSRLGLLLDRTAMIPGEVCAALPEPLPSEFPVADVVAELERLAISIRRLTPAIGRRLEREVYWAVPGVCSLQPLGNLDPVLLGVSSHIAEDLRPLADLLRTKEDVTTWRRHSCARWVVGGALLKAIASGTVGGAPPSEALYWGGVRLCGSLSDANTTLNVIADGYAHWRQFECIGSLRNDVLMTRDFVSAVGDAVRGAATGNTGCSTQVTVGSLLIPDVSSGWLRDYTTVSGTLPFANYGDTPGVTRAILNVYRKTGATYDELVTRASSTDGEQVLSPLTSSAAHFEFSIPAAGVLFANRYYAEARVIGSFGTTTRTTPFRVCGAANCFLQDTWNEVVSSVLAAGESYEQIAVASNTAKEAEFVLSYRGSDFDLHVYDASGRHVGLDYDTGKVENQIVGATYSGTDAYPEVISVPVGGERQYRVRVVAIETDGSEEFSLIQTNVAHHPATLLARPERVDSGGIAGGNAQWTMVLGEIGGQQDALNVTLAISALVGAGGTIPAARVVISAVPTTIRPATQETIRFQATLPDDAYGIYTGTISVSYSGGSLLIPVQIGLPNRSPSASAGPDLTLEANSAQGVSVTLDGSASVDPDGDTLSFEWTGPFGIAAGLRPTVELGLGGHIIGLTVDDGRGGTDSDDASITVRDTIAPTMTLPESIVEQASWAGGVTVSYSARALDAVSGATPVTCHPSSGALFPVGASTVMCTSTDAAGNTASGSFTVTVEPPPLSVLDDFNRANGELGSNWTGFSDGLHYLIHEEAGQAWYGGPVYWSRGSAFGTSQEAFVTLKSVVWPEGYDNALMLKIQSDPVPANPSNEPDWIKGCIAVSYNAVDQSVYVATWQPGSEAWNIYGSQPLTMTDGDKFGARVLVNGDIGVFRNESRVATFTLDVADQAFFNGRGGRIGLWFEQAATAEFDDFGGGSVMP